MIPAFPKPKDVKRKRVKTKHSRRNRTRTKRGMVIDLDKVARREVVEERDREQCQRCSVYSGQTVCWAPGRAVIQWAHVHTREYLLTRWEPDNSLALCSRCHVWFDNHKVLSFDWFAKRYPERWERVNRILQAKLLTDGNCKTSDAWVRALWQERVGGKTVKILHRLQSCDTK